MLGHGSQPLMSAYVRNAAKFEFELNTDPTHWLSVLQLM